MLNVVKSVENLRHIRLHRNALRIGLQQIRGRTVDSSVTVLAKKPTSWYASALNAQRLSPVRNKLIETATELFRRGGFVATTVDQICQQAQVTKGAFFHYFESKEDLAKACLEAWDAMGTRLVAEAPFQAITDPVAKVAGYMEFFMGLFSQPQLLKSCLAGTTLQEVSETHPQLRDAANVCFTNAEARLKAMLEEACRTTQQQLDAGSLAQLWIATVQGALLLCKGSRDETVIPRSLGHVKTYILQQLHGS